MKVKKKGKKELFYIELRDLIIPQVTYNLDNIEEIRESVNYYLNNQKHLKKVGKLWDDNVFMFVIGEKMIDLIIENLDKLVQNKVIYPLNYRNYEDFVMNKLNSIGLYKIKMCGSDTMTIKLVNIYEKKIRDAYYNYNEHTRQQKKVIELVHAVRNLNKLKGLNESIDAALENTKEELNRVLNS